MALLKIQPLSKDTILPTYDHQRHYTLYANEDTIIKPYERTCIPAGFKAAFPNEYCILSIGSIGIPGFIGLIDSDYRGEFKVIVSAHTEQLVRRGEEIANMIMLEIETPAIHDCTEYRLDGGIDE